MEELMKKLEMIHNIVKADITAPCRCPITAKQARPPSNRKMGNKLSAEVIIPNLPMTKSGCMGIGWANGSIMVLGNNHERINPTENLWTMHREAANDAMGPLNAKSTKAARFGGKDRRGVMHP
eukprot:CAMPEP_0116154974 /NCGR_PEP_ID=MMETSP0329-20121206/22063_1 /TAXON_ID=697910 /ORGANISM="Pseudo-nitzschia arenysensis, Strain B593" /LENGTH=122 /DNA_ID=CAMNT_0003651983 /DNA_START=139 /DNA_END=508 /DNA_ORIENTATION=-